MIRGLFNILVNYIFSKVPFSFARNFLYGLFFNTGTNSNILMGVRFLSKNITIGRNSIINYGCVIDGRGSSIIIGDNVDIAPYVKLWTLEHDYNSPSHNSCGGGITIGDNVWIAAGATILPGIKVGEGAVIGAAAVVTKNVEELTVVAGNPAKVIARKKNNHKFKLNYHPWFY